MAISQYATWAQQLHKSSKVIALAFTVYSVTYKRCGFEVQVYTVDNGHQRG